MVVRDRVIRPPHWPNRRNHRGQHPRLVGPSHHALAPDLALVVIHRLPVKVRGMVSRVAEIEAEAQPEQSQAAEIEDEADEAIGIVAIHAV